MNMTAMWAAESEEPQNYVVEGQIFDPSNHSLSTSAKRFGVSTGCETSCILQQDQTDLKLVSTKNQQVVTFDGTITLPVFTVDISINGEVYHLDVVVAKHRILGKNFLRGVECTLVRGTATISKLPS